MGFCGALRRVKVKVKVTGIGCFSYRAESMREDRRTAAKAAGN